MQYVNSQLHVKKSHNCEVKTAGILAEKTNCETETQNYKKNDYLYYFFMLGKNRISRRKLLTPYDVLLSVGAFRWCINHQYDRMIMTSDHTLVLQIIFAAGALANHFWLMNMGRFVFG